MFLPWLATTEVVTMKITSSTRKTSVSGVMLISATTPSSRSSSSSGRYEGMRHLLARRRAALARRRGLEEQQRLHEALARPGVGARDQADARLEIVEEQERRDRHREAHRRRDQRLGDARRHHLEAARTVLGHVGERADDADHGPEQADVRSERADRADHPEATLELVGGL